MNAIKVRKVKDPLHTLPFGDFEVSPGIFVYSKPAIFKKVSTLVPYEEMLLASPGTAAASGAA